MSELKGQLLGMVLVLAAFGAILGILIPAFAASAEAVNKEITVEANGSVKWANPNMTVVF
jgi:uncharacterized protein YggE